MRGQMEALMKLVNASHTTPAASSGIPVSSGPQVKLVPLTVQDDIEAYLVTFE